LEKKFSKGGLLERHILYKWNHRKFKAEYLKRLEKKVERQDHFFREKILKGKYYYEL